MIAGQWNPTPKSVVAPMSSDNHLSQALVAADFFGALPAEVIDVPVASRVPEIKKALTAHQALVSVLKFEKYAGTQRSEDQPFWVSRCTYPGMSRLISYKELTAELFWHGFAVLGAWLDTEGNVYDWIVLPRQLWTQDSITGSISIDERVPPQYRQRAIIVPTGTNGVLLDGIDSIRQARKLELARQNRLDSPPAATELHITDATRDEMTNKERSDLAANYAANRNKHSVTVTPSYVEVKERGISGQLDLFESAKNSLRLELAMHAGVPADFVEGGQEGSTGEMKYDGVGGPTGEIWRFGSAPYAYAVAAALSQDEVVGPDAEVRFDASAIGSPAPTVLDPEAGDINAAMEVLRND